jgi:hypothetical protein
VVKAKPPGAKGTYVKKVSVSSTMGPGVKIDSASLGGGQALASEDQSKFACRCASGGPRGAEAKLKGSTSAKTVRDCGCRQGLRR